MNVFDFYQSIINIIYLIPREQSFIFTVAILTFTISIILRTKKLFFIQLLVFFAFFIVQGSIANIFFNLLIILQLLLGVFVIYRWKKAIEKNYLLVLEKTHKIPRKYTKNSQTGSTSSFL